jgi:hypothetical protein
MVAEIPQSARIKTNEILVGMLSRCPDSPPAQHNRQNRFDRKIRIAHAPPAAVTFVSL